MLVIPKNHKPAKSAPLRKLGTAKMPRLIMGSAPRCSRYFSQAIQAAINIAPPGSRAHTHAVVPDSAKGMSTNRTAAPKSRAPIGSNCRMVRTKPTGLPVWDSRTRESRGRGNHSRPKIMAKMPKGMFTRNVRRQPISGPPSLMRKPPSTGPIATAIPTVEPKYPNAVPRSRPRKYC